MLSLIRNLQLAIRNYKMESEEASHVATAHHPQYPLLW